MFVAGEASGDLLGAGLIEALRQRTGDRLRVSGVGGQAMKAAGMPSMFPMGELSVMGLVEVLPRAPRLLRRIGQVAAAARLARPDALVTVDAPGFNLRVAARLQGCGVPLIHYVAPQVWAWRAGRTRKIAPLFDRLMTLLPFEPRYFEAEGLPCNFVGHPVIEGGAGDGDGVRFRGAHGIAEGQPLLLVLPGSRHSEVSRHLPIFGAAVARLRARDEGLRVVVPTVAAVAEQVVDTVQDWPLAPIVLRDHRDRVDAFDAANAALAASGTVALELAVSGVPTVIAYKTHWLTAAIARQVMTVDRLSLVNILLEREVQPEFLQQACTPALLAAACDRLLDDAEARDAQIDAGQAIARLLGRGGPSPSLRAADVVLEVMASGPRAR